MNWTVTDIIKITGATPDRLPESSLPLTGISTDSRNLQKGNLFVALKGPNFNGHHFIRDAVSRGAGAVLAQEAPEVPTTVPSLFVPDTLTAYGALARHHRESLKTKIIAITGSTGKTTTKEMAAAILSKKYRTTKTEKNENNRVGVPKTLLAITPETEVAVVELGSNLPGEIARLTEIVLPDTALITNITPAHLEGFKTLAGVRVEKSSLFWRSPDHTLRIINRDDANIAAIPHLSSWQTLSYTMGQDADIRGTDVSPQGFHGIRMILHAAGKSTPVSLAFLGTHHAENALAAAAVGHAEGVPLDDIKEALESLRPPEARLSPIFTQKGPVILNDAYNANPASTAMALKTLGTFNTSRATIAILGDMLELGENEARYHEQIGELCAHLGIHLLCLIGSNREATRQGAIQAGFDAGKIFFFEDAGRLISILGPSFEQNSVILVKGSFALNMKQWIQALLGYLGEKEGKS